MMTTSSNPLIAASESYVSTLLSRELPYTTDILGNKFTIKDHDTYPPGNLTRMFGRYIADSKILITNAISHIA